jgi:hypothetical protein
MVGEIMGEEKIIMDESIMGVKSYKKMHLIDGGIFNHPISKISAGLKRGLAIKIDEEGRAEAVDSSCVPHRVLDAEQALEIARKRKMEDEHNRQLLEEFRLRASENPQFGSW